MWPGQKVSDQGPGKTNYGVAVLISLKEVPFRHHTLVPAVLPLSEAFLELTLGNSQQLCCYISLYLLHAVKPIPLKKFSPLGIKKIHMGPCPLNRGLWHLWDLCLAKKFWTMWDKWAEQCHGAAAKLASTMQVACTAPHHTANGELRHSTP